MNSSHASGRLGHEFEWLKYTEETILYLDQATFPDFISRLENVRGLDAFIHYHEHLDEYLFDDENYLSALRKQLSDADPSLASTSQEVERIAFIFASYAVRSRARTVYGIPFRTRRSAIVEARIPWPVRSLIAQSKELRQMENQMIGDLASLHSGKIAGANADTLICGLIASYGHRNDFALTWYRQFLLT